MSDDSSSPRHLKLSPPICSRFARIIVLLLEIPGVFVGVIKGAGIQTMAKVLRDK